MNRATVWYSIILIFLLSVVSMGNAAEENSQAEIAAALDERQRISKSSLYMPYTLMAHKPNYILPVAYNFNGYSSKVYETQFGAQSIELDDMESQFQISIKVPLATNLFEKNLGVFFAYTHRSFWQVFNKDISAPFRETNHEPEAWIQKPSGLKFLGMTNTVNMLGINHQSNGRGGVLSRSWNRVIASFVFQRQAIALGIKAWARIEEDMEEDDNRDITDYLGHSEFRAAYKTHNHTLSVMSRNNIESGFSKGAVELTWSFPLGERKDLKGYFLLFSGYGESMISYNRVTNKVGIGIVISDWL